MTCETARQDFTLYLYGELEFTAEEALELHLGECESCRAELEQERTIHKALDREEWQPSGELLQACRRELRSRVGHAQAVAADTIWVRLGRFVTKTLASPAYARPIGALALVALGFLGGRLWDATGRANEPSMVRVRNLTQNSDGGVHLVLEEVRQKTMNGRLDDDRVRQMLLAAASDPSDPSLRARTLDVLKEKGERGEVRQALLQALQRDPNAGVRLKALDGLKPFSSDPETRRALSRVLLVDDNPGVRTLAIDMLVENMQGGEVIGTLQELIGRERNPYIRQKSLKALRDVNASVETF